MTACTWLRPCAEQGRHLVWRRGGLGDVETEVTCGLHLGDAIQRGYRTGSTPGVDTERLVLRGSHLREMADWVSADGLVVVDVPIDVADVMRQMWAPSDHAPPRLPSDRAATSATSSLVPFPLGGAARASGPSGDRPGRTEAPHLGPPPPGEGYGVVPRDAGISSSAPAGHAPPIPTRDTRDQESDDDGDDEDASHNAQALALAGVDVGILAFALMLRSYCDEVALPAGFGDAPLVAARASARASAWGAGVGDIAAAREALSTSEAATRPPTR